MAHFFRKFAIKPPLNISGHLKRVATLPCEMLMSENSTLGNCLAEIWICKIADMWHSAIIVATETCRKIDSIDFSLRD